MNYLAHAFLSHGDTDLLIGNFIADHVRGNNFKDYNEKIIEGIYLHRRIDSFTDNHQLFKESKRIFYKGFEKYSGILIDIYFDHLLAKNFSRYHNENLGTFSEKIYNIYQTHSNILPQSSSRFLEYVIKNNIYSSYSETKGIEKVLYHLSHRIGHNIRLDHSMEVFLNNSPILEDNFQIFFGDAIKMFPKPE